MYTTHTNAAPSDEELQSTTLNLYGTVADSIVDGPGLRFAVFVQGCSHHCPGCHNPESQPATGGTSRALADILEEIQSNPLIQNVTLSGGEPFEQPHGCALLARALKARGFGVWTYSGYLLEDLQARAATDPAVQDLLEATDVLVDGPFIQAKKSLDITWRGSTNQRVINLPKTLASGTITLWEEEFSVPKKPASW